MPEWLIILLFGLGGIAACFAIIAIVYGIFDKPTDERRTSDNYKAG